METNTKTESSVMTDMLLALLAAAVLSVYYYGMRAAAVIVLTTVLSVLTDMICLKMRKKDIVRSDMSALLTGLTLGLMMSASVPYHEAAAAVLFAVIVAKHAFGGHGCEIFNPAAAGFLFASLCFSDNMLTYPKAFAEIPMASMVPADILSQSMTKTFLLTGTAPVTLMDVLIGKFCGPMGTGFVVLLVTAAAFLMLRKSVSAITFFTEFAMLTLYAFIKYDFSPMAVLYFFSSGMLLFGMIFLSCDHSVIPRTKSSRLVYGLVMSLFVIAFYQYSGTENAVIYAVIAASPIGIELDRKALSFADMLKKRPRFIKNTNKLLGNINETLEMIGGESVSGKTKKKRKKRKLFRFKKKVKAKDKAVTEKTDAPAEETAVPEKEKEAAAEEAQTDKKEAKTDEKDEKTEQESKK